MDKALSYVICLTWEHELTCRIGLGMDMFSPNPDASISIFRVTRVWVVGIFEVKLCSLQCEFYHLPLEPL